MPLHSDSSSPTWARGLSLVAACCLAGCTLLLPYPGGGDPAEVFLPESAPGFPDAQAPLVDPLTDLSVSAQSLIDVGLALPGAAFNIHLSFQAINQNVVGGGIRFPGSDEVQWTFIQGVTGLESGELRFAYVLANDACEELTNLCHEIQTEQFAVSQIGGEFLVSPPVKVPVVLQCATCDSQTCVELVPAGQCKTCSQPEACVTVYEECFTPGAPAEDQAGVFQAFLGEDGALWASAGTCVQGEALCQGLLEANSCAL
jgi:hypothetical protein